MNEQTIENIFKEHSSNFIEMAYSKASGDNPKRDMDIAREIINKLSNRK